MSTPSGSATWSKAAIGSLLFHVGLVVLAHVLPDGSGEAGAAARDQLFTPGAVIPIEALPAVARAEPSAHADRPVSLDEKGPATAPLDRPKSSTPTPNSGADRPPDPQPAESQPNQAPGLSLHGMRDGARPSTTGTGVVIDPSLLQGSRSAYEQSVRNPGVGEGAVQGPSAPKSDSYAFQRENGKLIYRDPHGRFVATLRSDGRVDFRNKGAKASWTNIGLGGPGDLLMAAGGDDPYARLKAKLLEATFEMRLGMAVKFQKQQIDKRLTRLGGELDKIWADERRELGARKELLFQRWDECDEPDAIASATAELPGFGTIESSELDDARQSAAGSARRMIEKFIREHAPKGSPQAFTAAELADMNRRRASTQAFSPYSP